MPTITREWSIIYGSTTIGGSSDNYLLTNKIGLMRASTPGYGRVARVSFEFIARGSTEALFVSNCQAVEVAFAQPRQRLRVIHGLQTHIDFDPAAGAGTNTGFDQAPSITKPGSLIDTGRSRLYQVIIDVTLPSDIDSRAGRRESFQAIDYDANRRRRVTITGEFTAVATNDATAQFSAQIASFEAVVLATSLLTGATYQLIAQRAQPNDSDKVIQFARVHREITLEQASGVTDHASVVSQQLSLSEESQGIASTRIKGATVRNLKSYAVSYSAEIDTTVTTAAGLRALWTDTLRDHVIAQSAAQLGNGPIGALIDRESFDPDPEGNIIKASFRYRLLDGSLLISAKLSKQVIDKTGLQATAVTTGKPHEYDLDQGPPQRILIVQIQQRLADGGKFFDYKPPKNYRELERDPMWTKITEGVQPNQIAFVEKLETRRYLFGKLYKGGGPLPGAGGGTTTVERGGGGGVGKSVARGAGGNNDDTATVSNFDGDGI